MKGFGELIKKYRKEKKLTQKELGEKLGGLTKSYISKVESEQTIPKMETFLKIASILEVEIGDLFENKYIPPQELKDVGADWLILGSELEKSGISIDQVKLWAEIVKKHTNNK